MQPANLIPALALTPCGFPEDPHPASATAAASTTAGMPGRYLDPMAFVPRMSWNYSRADWRGCTPAAITAA
jgi:hypothetical protein